MKNVRTSILLICIIASSAIYGQDFSNLDSIQKVRDSIVANSKSKPKSGGSTGISVMSVNTGNKPAGSIAVNREPIYQNITPAQLIQNIFTKTGSCATVSNVQVSIYGWNGTSWSPARGLAYFNKADSNFPIEEGLVMSTGDARDTEGPNLVSSSMHGGLNNGADADLAGLTTNTVRNFCRIEFDFVPTAHVMEFKYIFASEEYPEYVNSGFNDVFGFFVNEVGSSTKTNIAILPDGVTPVTINNVNNGYQSSNCYSSTGTNQSNPSYFVPNPCMSLGTEMDGYTKVLTATYNVTPCTKYHLKLAVGNVGDQQWGSAVFLQARSFDVGRDLEFSGNKILGNEYIFKGCDSNYFDVTRTINTNKSATIEVTHSATGGATNGTHYVGQDGSVVSQSVSFEANQTTKRVYLRATSAAVAGSYFDLSMMCPCAGSSVAITKRIYIYDSLKSINASPTSACPNNANGKITVDVTGTSDKYEYRLGADGLWQTSNVFSGLSAGTYTVYARDIGTCYDPLSQTVIVSNISTNAYAGADINNCNSNVFTLAANAPGPNETGTWTHVSGGNVSFANVNQYNTTATLNGSTSATLLWTLYNGACSASDIVVISNNALPSAPTVTSPVSYCLGATASSLTATIGSGYSLKWYDANDYLLGTTAPTPMTNVVGSTVYKVSAVNNSTGCESVKVSITVNIRDLPTAKISAPSVICEETGQITLTFSLTGQSMWTIEYIEKNLDSSDETLKTVTSTTPTITVPATPSTTTEYIITRVIDGLGCINTDRDSVRVQFQPCGFKSPMLVWLKANDGVQTYTSRFEWLDKSLSMNIFKEAQKSAPYTNITLQNSAINFNQAVKFDGTDAQYLSGKVQNPNGFSIKSTLFTVTDPTPASTKAFPQGIFSTHDSVTLGQGLFFNTLSGSPFYVMGGTVLDGTHSFSNQNSTNINYPILLRGVYHDSLTTKDSEFWDNGKNLNKTISLYNNYPGHSEYFDVGGSALSPGKVFDGKIAEIIYFGAILPTDEANKVDSYLAIKYGISLEKNYITSNDSTAWNYSGNPTFKYHIAGIGFDAGYALDQRISHNTSPGDMVTVAHNPTAFVTDQSLASSITVDKSYLVWASNNGNKQFGDSYTYAGHALRLLNRRWRSRKTGTVGNVSIQFDTTGINIPPEWGRKPALVVTPFANFSGSFTYYQAAAGYTDLTFHNVDLSGSGNTTSPGVSHFTLVLTKKATANAGPDQSACSNEAGYEFTMDANSPGVDQAGKWEIVTEPSPGTVNITSVSHNATKVKLAIAGTARLRWIVWNTYSMDSDTSYVNLTRYATPEIPLNATMTGVCPGENNDSIVINQSNSNYLYKVYTEPTGGVPIATGEGTGSRIVIKPGNKITVTTCYYIEIEHSLTHCNGIVRWQVCIPVYADITHPDIRIKVCPNPAYELDLYSYLNAVDITNATFSSSNASLVTSGRYINTGNMSPSTYTLTYSVVGKCRSNSAKVYIQSLKNDQVLPVPKRVRICQYLDLARYVQLQQILGLDVDNGVWYFDSSLLDTNLSPQWSGYITTVDGAYIFNAQKAWLDGKGTLVGQERHFTFRYYINGSYCIPNSFYEFTVIVTNV